MKRYQIVWTVFLVFVGLISGTFTIFAGKALWKYQKLQASAMAHVDRWKIEELSDGKYALSAFYHFDRNGKKIEGKTLFNAPHFMNQPTAYKTAKDWSQKKWKVWFSPGEPAFSSLEKEFPSKTVSYALLALGVFVYFILLRKSVIKN